MGFGFVIGVGLVCAPSVTVSVVSVGDMTLCMGWLGSGLYEGQCGLETGCVSGRYVRVLCGIGQVVVRVRGYAPVTPLQGV